MLCPHFVDRRPCECSAVEGVLIPSLHERERFCRTDHFRACPTFRARVIGGEVITQNAYYALWSPDGQEDSLGV